MRDVDARVPEADPRVVGGKRQVHARLQVETVEHGPPQVAADVLDRLLAPDVAGGVRPDVGGPVGWMVLGTGVVGRVVYDSMAWVRMSAPAAAVTSGRRAQRVERIDDAQRGAQQAMRHARLHVLVDDVSDRDAVVSLPVPAVVGTAINGLSGPGTGRPCRRAC